MGLNLNVWRDKARAAFYKMSQTLGESAGIKPVSLHHVNKACESLALDLPSMKTLFPYETVNSDGFFINRNSMGFGMMLMPMSGADESLMKSLAETFKNKLTQGTDCIANL